MHSINQILGFWYQRTTLIFRHFKDFGSWISRGWVTWVDEDDLSKVGRFNETNKLLVSEGENELQRNASRKNAEVKLAYLVRTKKVYTVY